MKRSLKRMLRPEERKEIQGVAYFGVKEDRDCFKDSFKVLGNQSAVWSVLGQCGRWEAGPFLAWSLLIHLLYKFRKQLSVDRAGDQCIRVLSSTVSDA